MPSLFPKKTIIAILAVAVSCAGIMAFLFARNYRVLEEKEPNVIEVGARREVIGVSSEGRNIEAYTYGSGETRVLFVGGMHGGYEWNSILLAYAFMDHLDAHPESVPKNVTAIVIPSLNPDGAFEAIGKEGRFGIADVPRGKVLDAARFNARGVDLNRNFDCKWKSEGVWRGNRVSAGTEAFSEPESKALRDFILARKPASAIFWHSQANAVYASECESGILPETLNIMNVYSRASGYPAVKSFDSYEVTGDAEGWLASIGIPAVTVELQTHEAIEWDKNLKGIQALLIYYGQR